MFICRLFFLNTVYKKEQQISAHLYLVFVQPRVCPVILSEATGRFLETQVAHKASLTVYKISSFSTSEIP